MEKWMIHDTSPIKVKLNCSDRIYSKYWMFIVLWMSNKIKNNVIKMLYDDSLKFKFSQL